MKRKSTDPLETSPVKKPFGMRIIYHIGDLFELAKGKPKAHCVSADFRMGAGIALQFRERGWAPKINLPVGVVEPCARCVAQTSNGGPEVPGEIVFHLVTKHTYHSKPTTESLRRALDGLRRELEERKIVELWIPRIGSGLDRLSWEKQVLPSLRECLKTWTGMLYIVTLPEKAKK